jgi:hypothetical protein
MKMIEFRVTKFPRFIKKDLIHIIGWELTVEIYNVIFSL